MNGIVTESVANTVRQAFAFEVSKFPLTGPDGMRTPLYGLFRSDSSECVGGAVSQRYVPHTTEDVLALVEAAGEAWGGAASVRTYFRDGHYVAVQPTVEHRKSVINDRDAVWPRLVIRAPYGGEGSFSGSVGFYRDLCSNMSMLRRVSGTTVAIRHTSGLRSQMDELITSFGQLEAGWQNLTQVMAAMQERRVRLTDFLTQLYGEPDERNGRSRTMHRNRTEAIVSRLIRERARLGVETLSGDYIVSGWEAFNAVQGYVQHDSRRRGNPSDMARVVLAMNDSHVRRAEDLVYELAL